MYLNNRGNYISQRLHSVYQMLQLAAIDVPGISRTVYSPGQRFAGPALYRKR